MPWTLHLFHDQVGDGGASAEPLPPAHRLLYVRHGSAVINGATMQSNEAVYSDGRVTLAAASGWSQVWRWELALPNAAPALHGGSSILSLPRMSRVIAHMPLTDGSRWLFRLDQISSAAGRIADRHQHPGPGIRCLLEGTSTSRVWSRIATSRRASCSTRPGRTPLWPGARAPWRRNSCAAWCCRWSGRARSPARGCQGKPPSRGLATGGSWSTRSSRSRRRPHLVAMLRGGVSRAGHLPSLRRRIHEFDVSVLTKVFSEGEPCP